MYNEIITYYSKNPINKGKIENYTIEHWQDNRTCWDDIKVYIKITGDKIEKWSFEWDTSIITTACSSIFWESIIWKNLNEILKLDYNYIKELIEDDISQKRRNASVLWLLTTRNAIHKYLKDWIEDNFEDVLN
jgi:NifU-like protein involved in Fe-S cluster formation